MKSLITSLYEALGGPTLKTRKWPCPNYSMDSNFNAEQISRLSLKEVDAISEVLTKDLELVSFFGYHILESAKR